MTADRYLELVPLAALGALDGEDRRDFEAHVPGCLSCQAELTAHERVVARIPLPLAPVPPSALTRARVVGARAVGSPQIRRWVPAGLAAAAVAMAVGLLFVRQQRDAARGEAEDLRQALRGAGAEAQAARQQLAALHLEAGEARAFRALMTTPTARVATLAGLPAAPSACARVVWNPHSREAVLLAAGLSPAPEGKAYEVWVIAQGAPVAAAVFDVDAEGRALVRLAPVDDTARVKTFTVTLEPGAGVPAPTGPMVLAGAVS